MANMMGSWGIWLRNGVVEEKGLVSLRRLLTRLGCMQLTGHSSQDLKVDWQVICFAEATVHRRQEASLRGEAASGGRTSRPILVVRSQDQG